VPLYEYKCKGCDKTFEAVQGYSDQPISACKFCGMGVRRVIYAPVIRFVGTGFYTNDSKSSVSSTAGGQTK